MRAWIGGDTYSDLSIDNNGNIYFPFHGGASGWTLKYTYTGKLPDSFDYPYTATITQIGVIDIRTGQIYRDQHGSNHTETNTGTITFNSSSSASASFKAHFPHVDPEMWTLYSQSYAKE